MSVPQVAIETSNTSGPGLLCSVALQTDRRDSRTPHPHRSLSSWAVAPRVSCHWVPPLVFGLRRRTPNAADLQLDTPASWRNGGRRAAAQHVRAGFHHHGSVDEFQFAESAKVAAASVRMQEAAPRSDYRTRRGSVDDVSRRFKVTPG
jgi:hypothetical protein